MAILSINPENGETVKRYVAHGSREIDAKIQRAKSCFQTWRKSPFSRRKALLAKVSELLLSRKDEYAALLQLEMGKSLIEARAEVEKCASCADYYEKNGESFLTRELVLSAHPSAYVHFAPLGPILAIMPWNFPFWQAIRCAVPAIMAGNTLLLKHASNVSGASLALEELFTKAGAPDGLFQSLLLSGPEAQKLIGREEICGVSFTGSSPVGRQIAAAAGAALKKCVLELGGSDPYIVLADADVEMAAEICANSRLINAGQSCISAKRFLVEAPVYDQFCDRFEAFMRQAQLAPLARGDLRQDLHSQVEKSLAQGAKLVCGGKIPPGPGYHYPATILTEVGPDNCAFVEELFGPVAAITKAKDRDDAIRLANATSFGLGAAIFSQNSAGAEALARDELEAGSCFVNALVRSDPRLPFGGTKSSGFGRELAEFGIREFTNIKTVYISD